MYETVSGEEFLPTTKSTSPNGCFLAGRRNGNEAGLENISCMLMPDCHQTETIPTSQKSLMNQGALALRTQAGISPSHYRMSPGSLKMQPGHRCMLPGPARQWQQSELPGRRAGPLPWSSVSSAFRRRCHSFARCIILTVVTRL
jgi:hypothetical protein